MADCGSVGCGFESRLSPQYRVLAQLVAYYIWDVVVVSSSLTYSTLNDGSSLIDKATDMGSADVGLNPIFCPYQGVTQW